MSGSADFHRGQLSVGTRMTEAPVAVSLGTPLIEVALKLGDSGARYLLVCDEQARIAGVVSYGDVLRYMARINGDATESWKSRPVESLMTTRFEPSCPIAESEDVLGLVVGETISCVPILEGGRLVGMLTQNDLLMSWERMEPLIDAATVDEITELSNRTLFNRRIHEEWERSQRNGEPLAVLLFDLDFFKQVNDQCGHLIGDTVLSEIACCLRRQFRSYDVVSRFGGDEF
ncbi:MAG: diguanylate cyclase, partial [Planctomycetaceae bacterium]